MAVEIKYWERNVWASYLRNDVLPLYQSALTIVNLWRTLKDIADGKTLLAVRKDKSDLEYIFVGGTSPPDKYEEDGLAKIYYELLGTKVNLREYYFLKAHGKESETLCSVSKTAVLKYVAHIEGLLERAVKSACDNKLLSSEEVQESQNNAESFVEKILAKPETLPESFCDFLNKSLNLTISRNECTRFIWHLRKTPKKYIKEFYPELSKPDVFKFIKELLGLREFVIPKVRDPEIADLYTILSYDYALHCINPYRKYPLGEYGIPEVDGIRDVGSATGYLTGSLPSLPDEESSYPYVTLGGCMCKINDLIWGLFEGPCRRALELIIEGELPQPFSEWKNAVEVEVPTSISRELELNSYEELSILDEFLPAIFVGRMELLRLGKSEKFVIVERW